MYVYSPIYTRIFLYASVRVFMCTWRQSYPRYHAFVYACVFMHVCMSTWVCACTAAFSYIRECECMRAWTYTSECTSTHTRILICTIVYMQIYGYIDVNLFSTSCAPFFCSAKQHGGFFVYNVVDFLFLTQPISYSTCKTSKHIFETMKPQYQANNSKSMHTRKLWLPSMEHSFIKQWPMTIHTQTTTNN